MLVRWLSRLLCGRSDRRGAPTPEEERLRIEKLRHEVALARYQASPEALRTERRKAWTATTGLIVAIVGVGSLLVTMVQWLKSDADLQANRRQERLEKGIAALSSDDQFGRLAAIAGLRSFLGREDREQQDVAISALSSALCLETSPLVRDALRSALTSPDLPIATRNVILRNLAQGSRGLLAAYREARRSGDRGADIPARADGVAGTMIELLRNGAKIQNLNDTYLQGCDFRRMNLSGMSFDRAFLPGADFSGANLRHASFIDATLITTRFRGTSLRDAVLTQNEQGARDNYAPVPGQDHNTVSIAGPDFTCADLTNADLRGQPAFIIIANDTVPVFVSLYFEGANLKNANFSEVRMLASIRSPGSITDMPLFPANVEDVAAVGRTVFHYGLVDSRWPFRNLKGFDRSRAANRFLFSSVNWNEARLPEAIRHALEWAEVPSTDKPKCKSILLADLHGAAFQF